MLDLANVHLCDNDRIAVEKIIQKSSISSLHGHEKLWSMVDQVWDDYGCDNKNLNWDAIGKFYSHPVWLVNGLFIEQDDVSMMHRHAISDWVVKQGFKNIVDYGGGFGTLARLIAGKDSRSITDIYEPHPSEFGIKRAGEFSNINMVDKLSDNYEVLLSTDVLEHVADPLSDFSNMIDSLQVEGYLVIANCFHPFIKCHLPQNFHFRYTFNSFAKLMGLEVCGILEGSHATIFKKNRVKKINWPVIRTVEFVSKVSFSVIEHLAPLLMPVKRLFFR